MLRARAILMLFPLQFFVQALVSLSHQVCCYKHNTMLIFIRVHEVIMKIKYYANTQKPMNKETRSNKWNYWHKSKVFLPSTFCIPKLQQPDLNEFQQFVQNIGTSSCHLLGTEFNGVNSSRCNVFGASWLIISPKNRRSLTIFLK